MGENYVRSEFKIVAEIDGKKFRDVVSISATFGLNSIPTATLQVATGREVNTEEYATIHTAISTLRTRSKAKVTLTVKTNAGQKDKMMEDGDYVIFEGYYSGIGYQRSTSNSTYTIHLIHWIDDLNCSSMLNGNWFQGAPHNMASAAGCFVLDDGSDAGAAPGLAGADELVNKANMETDFWEEVIKPVFVKIAGLKHPNDGSPNGLAGQPVNMAGDGGIGGADNKAALDALKRMPGDSPVPGRLPLNLAGLDDILISYSATMGITHMFTNGMAYSSFWGKLVGELGSSFLFAVSPSAEFANVIPYFGGLAMVDGIGGDQSTISADEYNYASFNCNVANLIESVDIFYAQQASSGYGGGGVVNGKMEYYNPWGRFPLENRDFRGHILVRDPPAWIANCVPQALACPGTTLPPNGDAHTPQHGQQTGSGGALNAVQSEKNVQDSGILDRYAEHWFKTAVLSQRTGELSGKLRFDISPGCTVKIEAPDSALGAEKLDLYASVTQVSFVINAEQHVAGTSFTFTNVRNQHENQDQNLVKNVPPLYKMAWNGCPLAVKK